MLFLHFAVIAGALGHPYVAAGCVLIHIFFERERVAACINCGHIL